MMRNDRARFVFLTGAGVSAESGIPTFRAKDGLWENHRIEDVATPEAFRRDPELVLRFYNERRRGVLAAQPNQAHRLIADLQDDFDVWVITQNIDDLHERAGSRQVLHLHGEIKKARSTRDPDCVVELSGSELNLGDLCPLGAQLRPHIVWFGEPVPAMDEAIEIAREADLFAVVGTSLQVYPAAGLVEFVPSSSRLFLIDPSPVGGSFQRRVERYFQAPATQGMAQLIEYLRGS